MASISIVIPAYNGGNNLEQCLDAIERLITPPDEVIVVDDGSTDGSIQRAVARGIRVDRTRGRQGPAAARNMGAAVATGDIIFFLDSDVCVHPDSIDRVMTALADPAVDAVIGSYDDDPSSPDFLSQYKNLMHCFVHQTARSEASTFWSGCGAIRRQAFLELSGFDDSYKRPAIEDIELGYRLRQARRRIVLDRDLRARHLKKWTFWGLVKTDVLDRGMPWTELILRDHRMPDDLNIQISQRVSIALVYLILAYAAEHALRFGGAAVVPLLSILFILLGAFWADGAEHRSWSVCSVMIGGAAAIVAGGMADQHACINSSDCHQRAAVVFAPSIRFASTLAAAEPMVQRIIHFGRGGGVAALLASQQIHHHGDRVHAHYRHLEQWLLHLSR